MKNDADVGEEEEDIALGDGERDREWDREDGPAELYGEVGDIGGWRCVDRLCGVNGSTGSVAALLAGDRFGEGVGEGSRRCSRCSRVCALKTECCIAAIPAYQRTTTVFLRT